MPRKKRIWKTISLKSDIIEMLKKRKSIMDDKLLESLQERHNYLEYDDFLMTLFELETMGLIHVRRISRQRMMVSLVEGHAYIGVDED